MSRAFQLKVWSANKAEQRDPNPVEWYVDVESNSLGVAVTTYEAANPEDRVMKAEEIKGKIISR